MVLSQMLCSFFKKIRAPARSDSPRAFQDSSGSESYFSAGSIPLARSGSLPTSVPDFPDPSRLCHVTLWDDTSTVIYAKQSGVTTVAEALEKLCERRGARLSAIEVLGRLWRMPGGSGIRILISVKVSFMNRLISQMFVLYSNRMVFFESGGRG